MTPAISPVASDALGALSSLTLEKAGPAEARRAIDRLGQACPDHRIELLWEREGPLGSWRYTVVMQSPAGLTFSLGVSRGDALPWVMRAARRWSDGDLVRVNSTIVSVEQAIRRIDSALEDPSLAQRLVDECLIKEAIGRERIRVTTTQLQDEMDAFRRARRLYGAAALQDWLARSRLIQVDLEELLESAAAARILRRRLTDGNVEAHFEAHRTDFDVACIAQVVFASRDAAQCAFEAVRSGACDLYVAALEKLRADPSRESASAVELRRLMRLDAVHAMGRVVFDARANDVVGPVDCGVHFIVARVLETAPATLDAFTRSAIEQRLFDDWLRQQRASAQIEWFRGDEH